MTFLCFEILYIHCRQIVFITLLNVYVLVVPYETVNWMVPRRHSKFLYCSGVLLFSQALLFRFFFHPEGWTCNITWIPSINFLTVNSLNKMILITVNSLIKARGMEARLLLKKEGIFSFQRLFEWKSDHFWFLMCSTEILVWKGKFSSHFTWAPPCFGPPPALILSELKIANFPILLVPLLLIYIKVRHQ